MYGVLNLCVMVSIGRDLRKGTLNEIKDRFDKYLDLFSTLNYQEKVIGITLIYYLMKN